jgi:choice-of-anchor B domain-containing protein
MKKLILFAMALHLFAAANSQTSCQNNFAGIYPCKQMDLLAHLTNAEIGGGENTNDIWGWVSPVTQKEYALVGCNNGTAFLDISNPIAPVYLGILPTFDVNSLWRDIETYQDFVFVVSESGNHGIQIMNLLQLDNVVNPPVIFNEDAHYSGFGHCHTINIDPVSGILCAMGTNTYSGGPHLVNIQNPLSPALLGGYANSGYTHDGFITTYTGPDTNHFGDVIIICCNGTTGLAIVNATDPTDIQLLDTYLYNQTGYVHQGWFTKDNRYFLVNDELDEMNFGSNTKTHNFDLLDLDNINYLGFHEFSNTSIDHNLYMEDQFAFESNYRSGVRVLDAIRAGENSFNEVAYFDLVPNNDNPQFSGTWSNYPYLPSGINIATSMYDGFFITQPTFLQFGSSLYSACINEQFSANLEVNSDLYFPLQVSVSGPSWLQWVGPLEITQQGAYNYNISINGSVIPGDYQTYWNLLAPNGQTYTVTMRLTIEGNAAPGLSTLISPTLNANINSNSVNFEWNDNPTANGYVWTLATDANFTQNVITVTTTDTFYVASGLALGHYFWKIEGLNDCGKGLVSLGEFNVVDPNGIEVNTILHQVYPQPADIVLYYNGPEPIALFDVTGKEVEVTFKKQSDSYVLDTKTFSNGLYFLKTTDGVVKIMIRH